MLISEIAGALDNFRPVSLEELDNSRLMDRIDTKYLISVDRVPELLNRMYGAYKVLEINDTRIFSYSTTYLDTADYLFFNQHVTGRTERIKVRYRKYNTTGKTYLEVKSKINGNRTIKSRIPHDLTPAIEPDIKASEFIAEHVPYKDLVLGPVLVNSFRRITLAGSDICERITIDTDLVYSDLSGKNTEFPYLAIIEHKRERLSNGSPLTGILKECNFHATGFSKYCFGAAIMIDIPRKNILKPKFLLINKIENEYHRNHEPW